MFEKLVSFNNIVVSGPQRSGTRITAKIIAHDTGKTYVDEKDINYHDYELLKQHLQKKNVVVQCPGLCHKLHHITFESTLIIMVIRSIEEIEASENRCWDEESKERELSKYGFSSGIISCIKYNFWNIHQKTILPKNSIEIYYHDLEEHSLFIKNRKNFKWDQTEEEGTNG